MRAHAPKQFEDYCKCMDYNSNRADRCREQQAAFDQACPADIALDNK